MSSTYLQSPASHHILALLRKPRPISLLLNSNLLWCYQTFRLRFLLSLASCMPWIWCILENVPTSSFSMHCWTSMLKTVCKSTFSCREIGHCKPYCVSINGMRLSGNLLTNFFPWLIRVMQLTWCIHRFLVHFKCKSSCIIHADLHLKCTKKRRMHELNEASCITRTSEKVTE